MASDHSTLLFTKVKEVAHSIKEWDKNMAYKIQEETSERMCQLIEKAVELTGEKNIVVCGGYGLNCVANYHYLDALKDEGIEIYVEPISNDAGTAMGAALYLHYKISQDTKVNTRSDNVFLGPKYEYTEQDIYSTVEKYDAEIKDASQEDVVNLMASKNIVACFQGRSENGPRALGNRSLMFDPTFKDGKEWDISIDEEKKASEHALEDTINTFFKEYNDVITKVEFKLDTPNLVNDVKSQTKTFMKRS